SPEQRDDRAAHDGGVEAVLGRYTRGDGQGHGEGQGHDAHHDAGHGVVLEGRGVVSVREHGAQRGGHAPKGREVEGGGLGLRAHVDTAGPCEEPTVPIIMEGGAYHSGTRSAHTGTWSLTL